MTPKMPGNRAARPIFEFAELPDTEPPPSMLLWHQIERPGTASRAKIIDQKRIIMNIYHIEFLWHGLESEAYIVAAYRREALILLQRHYGATEYNKITLVAASPDKDTAVFAVAADL